ncbi:MAG: hypothetical protein JSR98_18945 [Proteobacteria bacterium]|nr:hypothetical protein [Pseudomonadota bacterium]
MSGFGLRPSLLKASGARLALTAAMVAAAATPVLAAPAPASAPERAQQLQSLLDCKKIADPTQRLACYDKAATVLDEAEAKGDVVVVNREQARKVRKQAFGFSLPSISLFERGEKTEDIAATESTIAEARRLPTGRWQIKLADGGGTWVQIDATEIPIDPKVGDRVKIRKASLGSYQMAVGNQREVKVHRVE